MTEDISPPRYEKKEKPFRISSMVGVHIELSNRFVADYERVIRFMSWLNDWK